MASRQPWLVGSKNLAKGSAINAALAGSPFFEGHARNTSHTAPRKAISGCIRKVKAIQSAARHSRDSSTSIAARTIVTDEIERGCRYWSNSIGRVCTKKNSALNG